MTSTIHRMRNGVLLASLVLLLGACGGSDKRDPVVTPPPTGTTPPPPPPSMVDSFFRLVAARVAVLLDNDEPVEIESAAATMPENTEPEPVPSN